MRQPSEKDIQTAKRFLIKRLDAELSMTRNLERLFRDAAIRIVRVCYKYNTTPNRLEVNSTIRREVERIIEELRERITDDYLTLCSAAADKDEDEGPLLLFALDSGFADSLTEYLQNFTKEMELLVGAGLFLGLSAATVGNSIAVHLRKPWHNPDLAEAVNTPLTYGRGRTNSMFTAVDKLTKFGIEKTWMRSWYNSNPDVEGYWVMRGSSYPCEICDAQVGWHPGEYELPPYHLSCCCIAVPIKSN